MADGITRFQQTIDTAIQDKLAMFMKSYAHVGFSFIPAGNHSEFSKGYDSLTTEMKQIRHAMLLVKKSEQNVIPLPYQRQEPDIQPGFGYLVENGKEQKSKYLYVQRKGRPSDDRTTKKPDQINSRGRHHSAAA